VWVDDDPDLLLAFEVDKELYEVAYAATYLPSWLWAPTEGLLGLFEGAA
jgi:predicted trehalose synthase